MNEAAATPSWFARNKFLTVFIGIILALPIVATIVAPSLSREMSKPTENKVAEVVHALPPKEEAEEGLKLVQNFDESQYRSSLKLIAAESRFFDRMDAAKERAIASEDPATKQAGKNLESALKKLQIEQFPKMRKAFAERSSDITWEDNLEIYTSGAGNKTITFVSAPFANNKNIADFQEAIEETLMTLRFKSARYEWYRGSKWWSYDIISWEDGQVIERD